MKAVDLDELERLAKAATPGPYTLVGEKDYEEQGIDDFMVVAAQVGPNPAHDGNDIYICNVGAASVSLVDEEKTAPQSLAHGKFLVAMSPETVLALIRELRRLDRVEAELHKLREETTYRYGRGRSHD